MRTRRVLLALAALAALAAGAAGAARASAAEGAIAVLVDPAVRPYREVLEGVERSTPCTVVELPRAGDGKPPAAATLAALRPKAVIAVGLDSFSAARDLPGVPVVAVMVPGLPALLRDRGNCYGIETMPSPAAEVAALRRLFPATRRIGTVYDPATAGGYLQESRDALRAAGLTLVAREAAQPREVIEALRGLWKEIDVFWMLPEAAFSQPVVLDALFLLSFEGRVPVFSFARKYAVLGACAALTVAPSALGAQAAEMAKALARGAGPAGGARWEYAREPGLVVNRKVSGKMGITFAPGVLKDAADVGE